MAGTGAKKKWLNATAAVLAVLVVFLLGYMLASQGGSKDRKSVV